MYDKERLQIEKDSLRGSLAKYTRKAFRMLPKIHKPRILDVGCGSGIPTLELAKLSKGEIIGIDIDQHSLDRLARRIEQAGFSDRVNAMNCSMLNMDFPDDSFDIIWAEGSTHIIRFERALKEWRRFLKPNGFLVVHDGIDDREKKLDMIPNCGYEFLCHFTIPDEVWWSEYFEPLEKRLRALREEYIDDPESIAILDEEQREIDTFTKNRERFGSVFFVMQKRGRVIHDNL